MGDKGIKGQKGMEGDDVSLCIEQVSGHMSVTLTV